MIHNLLISLNRLLGGHLYGLQSGDPELYHIDRCNDRDCPWNNGVISPDIFSSPKKKYLVYPASDESTTPSPTNGTFLSDSFDNTKDILTKSPDDLEMIECRNNSFVSMNEDPARCQSTSGVSVTKIKLADRLFPRGNNSIKPPNRVSNDTTEHMPKDKLTNNNGNIKVSRIKSSATSRILSGNTHLQTNNESDRGEDTRPKSSSTDDVKTVRVTSLLSKRLTDQSIDRKTTSVDKEHPINLSFRPTANVKKDNVTVTRVPVSQLQQRESNELCSPSTETSKSSPIVSPVNLSTSSVSSRVKDGSQSSVRVNCVSTAKKNTNGENSNVVRHESIEWY